jgi:hypothetical protein
MDVGLSLIYAVLSAKFFNVELTTTIILLSVAFGLLPDFDMSVEIFQQGALRGKGDKFHRKITHFPILYIPIIPFIFYRYNNFWGILFTVNLISHFIHDTVGTGFGLKWLWPFSKKNFKIFSNPIDGRLGTKFIVSWDPQALKITMEHYGDKNWLRNLYLTFSNVLLLELIFLGLGILVLLTALL